MANMVEKGIPKYLQEIENYVYSKLKHINKSNSELLEHQQRCIDEVLQVYRDAFELLISKSLTCNKLLKKIKTAYEDAIDIRNQRISQFITQDRVFGVSYNMLESNNEIKILLKQNEGLKYENCKLNAEIKQLKKDIGKTKDEQFSDYLLLMKERDARYKLYFENFALHMKLKDLDGSNKVDDDAGDPVLLRLALDRCREQLSKTQADFAKMTDDYKDTVPRREYDDLETKITDLYKDLEIVKTELQTLQLKHRRLENRKKDLEEEFSELKDRNSELERAGTPRPHWEISADFISGGRDRWRQLAKDLTSRDKLRVLLKELGPAAESDNLEHFDGLGTDPTIPPYLRYEGKVRNLRLSRREINVTVNDIWLGKSRNGQNMNMQEYVTKYFEDRYQQASVRAEWAYNLCSGAEQMLDEPHIKLFWGIVHGHLSEDIYWGYKQQWQTLKDHMYRGSKNTETVTLEEFEKIAKNAFPLKSDVDIKNIVDTVKKQLKMKVNSNEVNLDKLFYENEEGFEKVELARELYRQRQMAQDKYIREVVAELGGGKNVGNKMVTVENLKRAFAIVDPAIDHIRMDRYIRWAFSNNCSDISNSPPMPLRSLVARLASGDMERVGPRYKGVKRRIVYK